MKGWFKENKVFYTPVSWQGWLLVILAAAFMVHIFLAIDKNSHSVSDTLYGIFPFFVSTFVILGWIGHKTIQK